MEGHYALHVARDARTFKATVLGYPAVGGYGPTREAAICQAEAALRRAVASGEIVSVAVPELNPWLKDAGVWKDDPQWDEYQAALERYRREVDESERTLA